MEASYKKIPKASNFPDYKKEVNVRPRRVHDQALMSDDMLDPLLVVLRFNLLFTRIRQLLLLRAALRPRVEKRFLGLEHKQRNYELILLVRQQQPVLIPCGLLFSENEIPLAQAFIIYRHSP